MTIRFLALGILFACVGCRQRSEGTPSTADAAVHAKPIDHLGQDELVPAPATATLLGMAMPRDYRVIDDQPGEATAKGEAPLAALRRHVAEHTSNGVLTPGDDALAWMGVEIPGHGARKFIVRAWRSRNGETYLSVREEAPREAIDGGSGEVLKALGLDQRGYPTDCDSLR